MAFDPFLHIFTSGSVPKGLAADVRDTAFQANPFPFIFSTQKENAISEERQQTEQQQVEIEEEEAFWVFEDNPVKSINDFFWNSGWIKDCFGD